MRFEDIEQVLDGYIGPTDTADPKTRKRLRILEAASALFVEQGYRRTSVDQVAQRAGVAKGTVYLYFATKLELLIAAVAMEKKEYLGRLRPLFDASLPPKVRLKNWLEAALVMVREMPITSRLIAGDGELSAIQAELPPALLQQQDEIRIGFLGRLIEAASLPHRWTADELRERIQVLVGLAHFSPQLPKEAVRGDLSVERYAARLADVVVEGLVAPPAIDPAGGGQ